MKVRKILSALISAVETGGEITLADDIVLGESYITVRNRVTVILNLGGQSITSTYISGYNSDVILVGNNVIENYRTLTITTATVRLRHKKRHLQLRHGKYIYGGSFEGTCNDIYNDGTANIYGGTFNGLNNGFYNDGVAVIAGGTLNVTSISGGTFNSKLGTASIKVIDSTKYSEVIFTENAVSATDLSSPVGYAFQNQADGTYRLANVGVCSITITSADDAQGSVSARNINGKTSDAKITKGTAAEFYATVSGITGAAGALAGQINAGDRHYCQRSGQSSDFYRIRRKRLYYAQRQ